MSALSSFIGSLVGKEDLIVGLAVLLANVFAALGGCWWPIEVVPAGVRTAGMISPAWWAMDALHKLRFFQGDFAAILPNLGVLLGLSAALRSWPGNISRSGNEEWNLFPIIRKVFPDEEDVPSVAFYRAGSEGGDDQSPVSCSERRIR